MGAGKKSGKDREKEQKKGHDRRDRTKNPKSTQSESVSSSESVSVDRLRKQLDEKSRLAEERLNQIKYLQADFENYKKSLERERSKFEASANEALVRALLPLIDDLEAAVEKAENKEIREGYHLILKKMLKVLSESGLKPIEAVGRKFDPYYHEALISTESEKPEGTVLEELQKGYTFHSKVIRHSKVKIAKNKKTQSKKEGD